MVVVVGVVLPKGGDVFKRHGRLPFFLPPTGKSRQKSKNNEKIIPSFQSKKTWGGKTKQKSVQGTFGPPHKRATVSILKQKSLSNKKVRFCFLLDLLYLSFPKHAKVYVYIWSTRIGFTVTKK